MAGRSSDVDAWLAAQPEPFHEKLAELRDVIHGLVPGAGERIAYGIPIVTLNGKNLVGYNAAKDHYSLQLMSTTPIDRYTDELVGYRTGKGSVRLNPEEPLPRSLVELLVRFRIAENAERASKR
jgi:uncharacterized protein YdhG (YjbR/CyaY superfamily)